MAESWASGEAYERYMGRWSRPIAHEFLSWLAIPADKRWLDLGCGTGALSRLILDEATPSHVVGVDPSPDFIEHARAQFQDPRVQFEVSSATNLPYANDRFDTLVSGLALNFMPVPDALREMRRVTAAGGTVAAYVWDYAGKMEWLRYFWDVAVELDPDAKSLDEGQRFPICQPESLAAAFTTAGLRDVTVQALDSPSHFHDFDDYWEPFLCRQFPAPQYVATLSESQRSALRENLRQRLPVATDGSIHLVARAWAVRGLVAD